MQLSSDSGISHQNSINSLEILTQIHTKYIVVWKDESPSKISGNLGHSLVFMLFKFQGCKFANDSTLMGLQYYEMEIGRTVEQQINMPPMGTIWPKYNISPT